MRRITLFALILCFTPLHVFANDCSHEGVTVIYVNGILTDRTTSESEKEFLKDTFQKESNLKDTFFKLGYNPSHLAGVDDWLTSIAQIYTQGSNYFINGSDLDTVLSEIQPEVKTQKILLVGHSQGTFYTNAMYQYLLAHGVPKESLAVYNVATPADYVAGNGKYLNSSTDELIATIRALAEQYHAAEPLPANIDIPPQMDPTNTYPGHSFSTDYLGGAPDRIVSDTELGWLSTPTVAPPKSGCFDAPPINANDIALGSLYGVGDPVSSGGLLIANTEIDIALRIEKNIFAMAQAAYGLSSEAVSVISAAASALYKTMYSGFAETPNQAAVATTLLTVELKTSQTVSLATPLSSVSQKSVVTSVQISQSSSTTATSTPSISTSTDPTPSLFAPGSPDPFYGGGGPILVAAEIIMVNSPSASSTNATSSPPATATSTPPVTATSTPPDIPPDDSGDNGNASSTDSGGGGPTLQ
jgi:hypothetical protein